MQAILLAAGKSSRFYPYGEIAHKSLVSVMGKPLIVHTIENLAQNGITNVIIVMDKTRKVEKVVSEYELEKGVKIEFVVQEEALGMGNALLAAESKLENQFFLLNAYHVDFGVFAPQLLAKQKNGTVLIARKIEKKQGFGFLKASGDRVTAVIEKPEEGNAPSDLKVVGIYLLEKKVCEYIKKEKVHDHQFEHGLTSFAKDNAAHFITTTEKPLSLKYPWDLLNVKDYLLKTLVSHTAKSAKVAKTAILTGTVFVSDDAVIMDGAVVTGPCFIGKGSYIGTNSILRSLTSIENNVVIGAQMEVKNALIMNGTTTHGGYIGDSTVGVNNKIATYFSTANVRFDRENVQSVVKGVDVDTGYKSFGVIIGHDTNIGIRVTTMPGVIIGNNSIVGPNTNVSENVPSDTYYYSKFEGVIKKPKKPQS